MAVSWRSMAGSGELRIGWDRGMHGRKCDNDIAAPIISTCCTFRICSKTAQSLSPCRRNAHTTGPSYAPPSIPNRFRYR